MKQELDRQQDSPGDVDQDMVHKWSSLIWQNKWKHLWCSQSQFNYTAFELKIAIWVIIMDVITLHMLVYFLVYSQIQEKESLRGKRTQAHWPIRLT